MDLPRTPEDLHNAMTQPGDPLDDTLLKHGADLTEAEYRSLLGSKPHVDPVHPQHEAAVDRVLQANETDARPQDPTPLADGEGSNHAAAMKRFASDFAASASRDGVEPAVKALQTALNERAADWPGDDPQRPAPIMPDGLYGPKTHAALRRHVALGRYGEIKQAVERKRSELLKPTNGGLALTVLSALAAGTAGAALSERFRNKQQERVPIIPPEPYTGQDLDRIEGLKQVFGKPYIYPAGQTEYLTQLPYPVSEKTGNAWVIYLPHPPLSADDLLLNSRRQKPSNRIDHRMGQNLLEEVFKEEGVDAKHLDGGMDKDGNQVPEKLFKNIVTGGTKGGSFPDTLYKFPDGTALIYDHYRANKDGSSIKEEDDAMDRMIINAPGGTIIIRGPKEYLTDGRMSPEQFKEMARLAVRLIRTGQNENMSAEERILSVLPRRKR